MHLTVRLGSTLDAEFGYDPKAPSQDVEVSDTHEAAAVCMMYITKYKLRDRNWSGGQVSKDGKPFAYISYALRIWHPHTTTDRYILLPAQASVTADVSEYGRLKVTRNGAIEILKAIEEASKSKHKIVIEDAQRFGTLAFLRRPVEGQEVADGWEPYFVDMTASESEPVLCTRWRFLVDGRRYESGPSRKDKSYCVFSGSSKIGNLETNQIYCKEIKSAMKGFYNI